MRILHISTTDKAGGAEKMAYELFRQARLRGHDARLAVGRRTIDDPAIIEFPNDGYRNPWSAFWRVRQDFYQTGDASHPARLAGWLANLGELPRWAGWQRGHEDFDYPAIGHFGDWLPWRPDIVHLHNLHGGYFDLRALPALSANFPTVVTMHDEWLYTGHCAYTFACDRWRGACGSCPDLKTYPALKRDGTAFNLRRKAEIYRRSRLYAAASSRWVIGRARESILRPALAESRVIRYGIDLEVFRPAPDRAAVRAQLDLPPAALVVLFIANRTISNQYKDYGTLEQAVNEVAQRRDLPPVIFLCVGEAAAEKRLGAVTIRYQAYQSRPEDLARFYQAADIYLHAARAEAFGLVMAEAMACGLPVIATAVGGIPEVVDDGVTGLLVPAGGSLPMAEGIARLLRDGALRQRMADAGQQKARREYNRQRHSADYLEWYEQILDAARRQQGPEQGVRAVE